MLSTPWRSTLRPSIVRRFVTGSSYAPVQRRAVPKQLENATKIGPPKKVAFKGRESRDTPAISGKSGEILYFGQNGMR